MSQLYLGNGPGTLIQDANAPELMDKTLTDSSTGSWVYVGRPEEVAIELVTGAMSGTNLAVDIEIEGADDDSSTGLVSFGAFPTLDASSDSQTLYLEANVYKAYMRAVATVAGSSESAVVAVNVRQQTDRKNEDRTAG